jgi:sugar phosphate isomerase/epimerase
MDNPEQWIRILGRKPIVGIHIKDFKRGPGDHFGTYDGFVPLFHGSVNWPAVMRQLAEIGFDDYLITEVSLGCGSRKPHRPAGSTQQGPVVMYGNEATPRG